MVFHYNIREDFSAAVLRGGSIGAFLITIGRTYIAMKRKIYCPICGKWLFSLDIGAKGTIYVWCRSCKREIKIKIEP